MSIAARSAIQHTRVWATQRSRQASLYAAYGTVTILAVLGFLTWAWLWQVQDWGIATDRHGEVIRVPAIQRTTPKIAVGDLISPEDIEHLQALSAQVSTGAQITIPFLHRNQRYTATLEARRSDLAHLLDVSIETIVGIGFVLTGIAPLIARNRGIALWLFFLASELVGLFLIAEGPHTFHVPWAEFTAYSTVTLFPAVLFHFHVWFPRPQLGRWQQPVVRAMYSLASVLTALNLFVWQHPDLDNDLWTFVLRTYLAGSLLGSLLLLLANYRAQTPRIRTQLRTIVVCSGGTIGINVLLFAVASLVPAPWRHSIENAGVFAALLSPISYAYSMLRYDVLIEGVLGRRWLIRCLTVSLFLLLSGWGWLFVVRYPVALNDTVALGLILAIGSVLLGVITTTVGEWLEARVLRGHTDVDLLDYATRELGSFHKLDEFVQFLTTALPKRLHSIGCLVFLATESGGLVLRGSSPTMTNLHPQEEFSITPCSDISTIMQHTHHPIPLDTLAITSTPFSAEDSLLLAALRTARIALLVPLVSSQQGRVIGLIAVGVKETDEPYSPQEIAALSALARAAAASAQNVLLFDTLQQQIQALSEEREDRLALARQINVEQEAVRKRISRDLHDRPVQELSVLKRALTALREDVESWIAEFEDRSSALEGSSAGSTRQSLLEVLLTERRRLEILLGEDVSLLANVSLEKQPTVEGLISQAATTLTMLRGICDDLHPGFLSGSLRKILNDSIARAMKRHPQIKFILETPGQEGEDFPDELKEACKEIVDQAIHNAVVHGLATQIKVHLKHTSEGIVLTVSDNGCGFIPSPPRKLRAGGHHGVANMTERAELLGGLLQITSRLDQGTQVEATFQRNAIPVVPTSKPHTLLGRSLLPRSSTEATLHH